MVIERRERVPRTVKAAALLLGLGSLLQYAVRHGGVGTQGLGSFVVSWSPWSELIGLALALTIAWALVRLYSFAYWFVIILGGINVAALLIAGVLALLGRIDSQELVDAGPAAWSQVLLFVTSYALLLSKPSRRAPWTAPWKVSS